MRWHPGLFSVNDFTVPGAATKQGRRQKPCNRASHFPPRLHLLRSDLRVPVAVLLRSAISEEVNSKKPLPGRVDVPVDHSFIRGSKRNQVSLVRYSKRLTISGRNLIEKAVTSFYSL